jgi:hypothetical protein
MKQNFLYFMLVVLIVMAGAQTRCTNAKNKTIASAKGGTTLTISAGSGLTMSYGTIDTVKTQLVRPSNIYLGGLGMPAGHPRHKGRLEKLIGDYPDTPIDGSVLHIPPRPEDHVDWVYAYRKYGPGIQKYFDSVSKTDTSNSGWLTSGSVGDSIIISPPDSSLYTGYVVYPWDAQGRRTKIYSIQIWYEQREVAYKLTDTSKWVILDANAALDVMLKILSKKSH